MCSGSVKKPISGQKKIVLKYSKIKKLLCNEDLANQKLLMEKINIFISLLGTLKDGFQFLRLFFWTHIVSQAAVTATALIGVYF
jgi:hypothetical protein